MARSKATPWGEDDSTKPKVNWGSTDPGQWHRDLHADEGAADPATAVDAPADDETADDLADLFGADEPVTVTVDLVPATAPRWGGAAPGAPVADPAPATTDDLLDVFGADDTGPLAQAPIAAAPVPASEHSDASSPTPPTAVAPDWMRGRRWEHLDKLWTPIQGVLTAISSDEFATAQLRDLKLTRDRSVDAEQRTRFVELARPRLMQTGLLSAAHSKDVPDILEMAYDEYLGLGPISGAWWDDDVTEILVDGPDAVYIERNGRLESTPIRFRNLDHVQAVARNLSEKISDRQVSPGNPLVTAELPGARVTFAYGDVVKSGISITLRKFRPLLGMSELLARSSLSAEMAAFLTDAVTARATALVSGGTGTGKTTFVNALSESIPETERVVTIEDAFELQLSNRYVVNLQTKERATVDATTTVTQADLLVNALRMRPDRIIVGEIRDPQGARVMLQAANTGHDGTMSTIHANTTAAALTYRLAGLLQMATGSNADVAMREVVTAIDLVVQVTRRAGLRFVSEIAVVEPSSIRNGEIVPTPIFTGTLGPDGVVRFNQTNPLPTTCALALKIAEAGLDAARWQRTRA